MTQQPPIAEGLQQVMGASATPSGSRASHEAPAGLHPSRFDPSRMLAIMADLECALVLTREYAPCATVCSFVDSSIQFKRLADFLHDHATVLTLQSETPKAHPMTRITEDTQEMVTLLPCPFCDGAPEAVQRLTEVAIICSTPDCMARQNAPNAKWAADRWNHRTASQLVGERDARIAQLESALRWLRAWWEPGSDHDTDEVQRGLAAADAALSPNQGAKP